MGTAVCLALLEFLPVDFPYWAFGLLLLLNGLSMGAFAAPNRAAGAAPRMIGRAFECEEPCVWQGQNKMLFKALLPRGVKPDQYLVAVRAREVGRLMVGLPGWSSDEVWVIALSEWREEQEGLLLMAAHGWVRTSIGKYTLKPMASEPRRARLELALTEEI